MDLKTLGAHSPFDGRVFLLEPPLEHRRSLLEGPPDWLLRHEALPAQVAGKDSRTPNSHSMYCITALRVHNATARFNCSERLSLVPL
jgi:hypothetical protein